MIDLLVGVGLCAALFALFGVFRHRGCTGHCVGCDGACGRHEEEDNHHAT